VIVVIPTLRAVATPVPDTTVATELLLLLHVPPGSESTSVFVLPKHMLNVLFEVKAVLTVTTFVAEQLPVVYEIVVVPFTKPETIPDELTVATEVLLLLQVPPDVAEASDIVVPRQSVVGPLIAAGEAFTVMVISDWQPVANLYVTGVVPPVIPTKAPVVLLMVPTAVLPLIHVPPVGVAVSVVVIPEQITEDPDIEPGSGYTVTTLVVTHPFSS